MDHVEAQELLEVAAAEPGGLDRLMAGDTAEAAALAGHLAGCEACTAEVGRLRREAELIRETLRSLPPEGLRARTLAYVAAVGRERGGTTVLPADEPAPAAGAGLTAPAPWPARPVTEPAAPAAVAASRRLDRPAAWLAAIAALLVVAVTGTALLVNGQRDAQLAARNDEIAARTAQIASLERIATAGLRVAAEPDAAHVTLAAADGGDAAGSLVFSPATRELVVLATGLTEPGDGREFRCWVEVDGERRPVGRMFFADDLAFWAGPVDAVADLPAGATFGVTLVDAGGTSLDGPATLSGAL